MTRVGKDVIVIGGGLHGLSSAFNLARRGASVAVLEGAWVGRHASGASAAGVRTLGRDLRELPLSLEAGPMWHDMAEIVGDDCGFHAVGQLRVAETEEGLAKLSGRVAALKARGHDHERMITAADLQELAPGISRKCLGGSYVASDGSADPHKTLRAYRGASERHGVAVHENCPVQSLKRQGGLWQAGTSEGRFEAPVIVNAAGAWAGGIAALAGEHIPLGTKASMMLVTERLAARAFPVISAEGRPLSFKQTDEGTLLIGGGSQGRSDLAGQRASVDFLSLSRTVLAATELFDWTSDIRIVRTWAGLEARTEDYLPVICRSETLEGVVHVFGFSGHGFQLVPVAGQAVADLVFDGETRHPIAPFTSARLAKRSHAA